MVSDLIKVYMKFVQNHQNNRLNLSHDFTKHSSTSLFFSQISVLLISWQKLATNLISCLFQPQPASSTSVGSGSRSPSKMSAARPGGAGGSNLKQRKTTSSSSSTAARSGRNTGAGTGGMWRFYTDDSPGIKVGPVPVLVMSLLFIASVFMLHIWGKYTRA